MLVSSHVFALGTAPGQLCARHKVSRNCLLETVPCLTATHITLGGAIIETFMGQPVCMAAHCPAGVELIEWAPQLRRHGPWVEAAVCDPSEAVQYNLVL